ncbi:MAG: hypothetical protein ICV60_18020 [Pyrinomonadaceae bacterium]|nr:hypothetical protein [Pyrinomonadaceae bacterium]
MRLKATTLVILWLCAWAVPAWAQPEKRPPMLMPQGTLAITCQLNNAPYPRGTIYVDGQKVGSCPGLTERFFVGPHSIRVGVALGNNRYLIYENERVEVRKDGTQNITAALSPTTAEKSPALAFALGIRKLAAIPATDDFDAAAFSPDSSIIAINAETNSVLLYDGNSGRALRRLGEKGEYWVSFVTSLSFSADGRLLASDGSLEDTIINIWDVKSGRLLQTIHGAGEVSALALSPDGKLVAAGVELNSIKLWRVADGKLLWSINPQGDSNHSISTLLFSPDGQMLIASRGGIDESYVYETLTAKHRRTLQGRWATMAADGRVVTYLFKDGFTTRNTWRSLMGELMESKRVKYGASELRSELIMVYGSDVWNTRSEQMMLKLPGYYVLALSADGRRALINGGENSEGGYFLWSLPAIPDNAPN